MSAEHEELLREKAKKALENDPRPPKKYWQSVQSEINDLVCGNSENYKELRVKLNQATQTGEKGLATLIAANIAASMGIEAGLISDLIALCLFSIKSIGINAYCRSIDANVR